MKKTSKKLTSFFLAILLCICALPLPALASYMPANESPQAEAAFAEETGTIPEKTASPAAEPVPAPETTPTPVPSEVIGSGGEASSSFSEESQSPEEATPSDTENERPEAPASVEAEPKLEPEEPVPSPTATPDPTPAPTPTMASVPVPSDGLLAELDIQPISYAVVDEPLVKVTYHYTDVQEATSTKLPTSSISAHSYAPLAKLEDGHVAIPANMFPGKVTVCNDALKVTLDGELDVTVQAEYDAASGILYLPERYWGHRIDVSWYCSYDEVTSISISVDVGISRDGAFQMETRKLTLPSNAGRIEIPLPEGENIVVSQCGIDLPQSAFTVEDGVLYVLASPLGGNIKIAAYAAAAPRARLNATRNASVRPSSVVHTRSADQIWYGYYTSYYTANGNVAFCVDPLLSGLDSGTYPISRWLDSSDSFLIKCAYYLYGGPGYDSIKYNIFGEPDAMWAYGMSHAVASYAYLGSLNGFEGLDDDLANQLIQIGNYINSLPAPPDGFEVFLYNSGNRVTQALVGWQYTPGSEPDPDPPTPPPAATGNLLIRKVSADPGMTDNNPCYSLAGAVFDVYDASGYLGATVSTDANGYADIDSIPVGSGYYFVERKPPQGFIATGHRYTFVVSANTTTTITVENVPQNDPTTIMLRKQDADTNSTAPQGGAKLAGAQFTIKYYKGSYSSTSALSGATPARTWVIETDEDGFAMLHPDYLVSGDAFYYNSAGTIVTLPLGTVTIQETKAPEGYLINNELFIRQITASGSMESVETYNEPIVKESVIRGGVSVEKWDAQLNRKGAALGDATLAGAVLEIINRTGKDVVVGGKTYGPGQVVHTLTTDERGAASTANNLLPYGEYEIKEKTPPTGYLNTGAVSRSFEIRTNGVVVNLTTADTAVKNDVIRGGVLVEKWDMELNRNNPPGRCKPFRRCV